MKINKLNSRYEEYAVVGSLGLLLGALLVVTVIKNTDFQVGDCVTELGGTAIERVYQVSEGGYISTEWLKNNGETGRDWYGPGAQEKLVRVECK